MAWRGEKYKVSMTTTTITCLLRRPVVDTHAQKICMSSKLSDILSFEGMGKTLQGGSVL